MDLQLTLNAKPGEDPDTIIVKLNQFLNDFNAASEKRDRKDGVVHNWKFKKQEPNTIVYDIDLGSVGYSFLKKLLQRLSKHQQLTKVLLD